MVLQLLTQMLTALVIEIFHLHSDETQRPYCCAGVRLFGVLGLVLVLSRLLRGILWRMVNCAIVECRSRSPGHKVRFFKLPKVVTDKGIQMLAITSSRRLAWLKAISRENLPEDAENVWVCEKHFVKGQYSGLISITT